MHKSFFIITLSIVCCNQMITAQSKELKKDLSQARTYIKSGKELDKAIKLMTDQLQKSEEARQNEKVYLTWYEAVEKQYAEGNQKLYLKETYDTAKMFHQGVEMFKILETLDSLAARSVKRQGDKVPYRSKHSQTLNVYRPNLLFGGSFFLQKKDFLSAFTMFDTYIDCARQPLFADNFRYAETDTLLPYAAYLTTVCGSRQEDAGMILKYADTALQYKNEKARTLQHLTEAYKINGDTAKYVSTLKDGFKEFPLKPYFFTYLYEWYTNSNMQEEALELCNEALAHDSNWQPALIGKARTQLDMERNEECATTCDYLLTLNDSIADAWLYAATAHINMAHKIENRPSASRTDKSMLRTIYQRAMQYMERYRSLCPDDKERWAPALYRIYLNLNMGAKFDEIDKILNSL